MFTVYTQEGFGSSTITSATDERAGWVKSLWMSIARMIGACADYYRVAATYEQLAGLSDAELERRGLTRATLARDICDATERTNRN